MYITHTLIHSNTYKMILQGTVQGGRRRGRLKKRWEDNITEWTGLKLGEALQKAENREDGEQWLPDHPWCPNGQIDYGISEVKWSVNTYITANDNDKD